MVSLRWRDATNYAWKLTLMERQAGVLGPQDHYRLPSVMAARFVSKRAREVLPEDVLNRRERRERRGTGKTEGCSFRLLRSLRCLLFFIPSPSE